MKKIIITALLLLTSCATPVTNMKKGDAVVSCGGGTAGSVFGGMIGYTIQEGNDKDCVHDYAKKGYKIVTPE